MNNKTLHLLWCTIRPTIFVQMHSIWISKVGILNGIEIETHVAVDTQSDANIVDEYLKSTGLKYRIIIVDTNTIGVCYPSYKLSSSTNGKNGDIIVFASDDFLPPNDWVNYLFNKIGDRDCGLMVNDGYQAPDSSNMLHPVITIPILTYSTFEKLNKIIYHPAYSHMFSDSELYINLKDLNLLYDDRLTDNTIFEHFHHASGKRTADNADVAYSHKWVSDSATWQKRKLLSVEKRLEV